jgi:hypothetical protein
LAGKLKNEIAEAFARDTHTLTTAELMVKYDAGNTTVKDWRRDARDRLGLTIGFGKGAVVQEEVEIEGLFPIDWEPDIDAAKAAAFAAQKRTAAFMMKRQSQVIRLPNRPSGMAYLSDLHLADPYTDYVNVYNDAEIIERTPDLHCGINGDALNNWIVGKLQAKQRSQIVTFESELALFTDWINSISNSLRFALSGNHELWSTQLAGIDIVRDSLKGLNVLYDPHEIVFTLKIGKQSVVHKARHSWRGYSIFNDTHGIEVGWQRGDTPFDIGIGGHTHIGTLLRPFIRHKVMKKAILIGTYKMDDEYARALGLAQGVGLGSGAMVFHPDGRQQWCEDLETAADFIEFWQKQ